MRNTRFSACFVATMGLTILGSDLALGCDIPVFQYALDYWEPDVFEIRVYHRGDLDPENRKVLKALEDTAGAHSFLNYTLETVDLEKNAPLEPDAEVCAALGDGESVVVIHSPPTLRRSEILWKGPLSQETLARIVDSPLRRKIGERLSSGTTAVWVLLESGDEKKDEAAHAALQNELGRAEGPLEFLGLTGATSEVQLSYDIERLSRGNDEESFLAAMLLSTEPDLRDAEFDGLPMAFPIFGRGRALYALIGEGINPNTIREACDFLTGACSCEIKDLNPGADLLLAMDWKSAVAERVMAMEEEKILSDSPSSPAITPPAAVVAEPVVKNMTLVVTVLTGLVALGTLALFRRGQSS